jgi:hypothetical protein
MTDPVSQVLTVRVSPLFSAVLDHTLTNRTPRTTPRITALAVSSDGFLFGWNTDHPDKEGFIGSISDFETNLHGVCATAGLGPEDTEAIVALAFSRVADWRVHGRKGASPCGEVRC